MQKHRPLTRLHLVACALLILASSKANAQWGASSPPTVGVITVAAKPTPVLNELPGRVAAIRVSEVRARVTGILMQRVFEQGTLVEEGQVLYRIDPELFKVRVSSAEAALQRALATQENAKQQLKRQTALRDRNVVSGTDYDTADVLVRQADADVLAARASLDEARINLSYTEVRAPITGIIGGALVTEGALVTADGSQNLALIQQIDPVYADFTQPASEILRLKRAIELGELKTPAAEQVSLELLLDDGTPYPEKGRLLFSTAKVDTTTGQVTLRGEFPNRKGALLPGLYVRVRVPQAVRPDAISIPQRAVNRANDGSAQVYVVGADDVAEPRTIILGRANGSEWIVESGLERGERVIVDGVMKVQPFGKVVPEPHTTNQQPSSQH
ncbi:efflux RND transporter periplasmic adaptor subunit [Ensifer adhaerens]|uniref:efflux RND transporter periplasmic adaptor subunit n=1 Tax=Ensifer adhaerens TaxID=106592 RepID=UPI001CC0D2EF|nr:efflux RND transporter periplasmic adaptor subunit [Ensifer adhaerens]MBZ7927748.1 efflux RND transporter periplasmic adaptor subunit [Ensifer adhaerens]UAX96612.1 efflux RND transporter periplasmic adaptor subunit [Ensifer adhaerens]UAY04044.1 efflux RND transporter periplasmic adaptor subunit [Ensifer adhaerens]UAY12030.1 efflux RND transporter periplasmic adaptor subunit [Ensifer adhaerens]